jgi:hypothetical protein
VQVAGVGEAFEMVTGDLVRGDQDNSRGAGSVRGDLDGEDSRT